MNLITVTNLSMRYESRTIFSDLSFRVLEGDYLCVVGDNGSGKTTLIKGLLGLKQPLAGKIELTIDRNEIGYLPQKTAVQSDFPANVREVVASGVLNRLGLRPFLRAEERTTVQKNLQRLRINELQTQSFRALSGGQQQKVLLARALCAADRLLILDEPVTGLDPQAAAEFYRLVKELNQSGIAILMVSHDIRSAVRYANHILHLGQDSAYFDTTEHYRNSKYYQQSLGV